MPISAFSMENSGLSDVVVRGSKKKFADTKGVISSRELKKDMQYNDPKKEQRRIYTTLHRNKKIKQKQREPRLKPWV